MTNIDKKEKGEFSTLKTVNRQGPCRIFKEYNINRQISCKSDREICQIMPNIFLAFSDVIRETSSTETCLMSAICSATSFT